MRVDLGGDQWAELSKDPEEVTNDDSREALNRFAKRPSTDESLMATKSRLLDCYLELLVEKWSFDLPVPGEDSASMGRLPVRASRELYRPVEWLWDVTVDFSPKARNDPKADTGNSNG